MKKILSILCITSLCLGFNIQTINAQDNNLTAGVTAHLSDTLADIKLEEDNTQQEESYEYNQVGYVKCNLLNVRQKPNTDSEIVDQLTINTEVNYDDYNDEWAVFLYKDNQYFLYKEYLVNEKVEIQENLPMKEHLTRQSGIFYGPNGKETYYNLDMSGVISIMRSIGNNDEYWVRYDGVKMLGNYVMIAANLNVYPRGSHIMTSLGEGVVCDTGDFVTNGSGVSFDIAVTW